MKIKEWLPDRYLMLRNAQGADAVFRGIWKTECDSEAQAKQLLNSRIEAWQYWLRGLGFYSEYDTKQIQEDPYTLSNEQTHRRYALREVS